MVPFRLLGPFFPILLTIGYQVPWSSCLSYFLHLSGLSILTDSESFHCTLSVCRYSDLLSIRFCFWRKVRHCCVFVSNGSNTYTSTAPNWPASRDLRHSDSGTWPSLRNLDLENELSTVQIPAPGEPISISMLSSKLSPKPHECVPKFALELSTWIISDWPDIRPVTISCQPHSAIPLDFVISSHFLNDWDWESNGSAA